MRSLTKFMRRADWHKLCINTEKNEGYRGFTADGWMIFAKAKQFCFRFIEFDKCQVYALVLEHNLVKRASKPLSDLFRMEFGTTPLVKEGEKKVFLWSRAAIWINSNDLDCEIVPCKVHDCKNFVRDLYAVVSGKGDPRQMEKIPPSR